MTREDQKVNLLNRLAAATRILETRSREQARKARHGNPTTRRENEDAQLVVLEDTVRKLESLL